MEEGIHQAVVPWAYNSHNPSTEGPLERTKGGGLVCVDLGAYGEVGGAQSVVIVELSLKLCVCSYRGHPGVGDLGST